MFDIVYVDLNTTVSGVLKSQFNLLHFHTSVSLN